MVYVKNIIWISRICFKIDKNSNTVILIVCSKLLYPSNLENDLKIAIFFCSKCFWFLRSFLELFYFRFHESMSPCTEYFQISALKWYILDVRVKIILPVSFNWLIRRPRGNFKLYSHLFRINFYCICKFRFIIRKSLEVSFDYDYVFCFLKLKIYSNINV